MEMGQQLSQRNQQEGGGTNSMRCENGESWKLRTTYKVEMRTTDCLDCSNLAGHQVHSFLKLSLIQLFPFACTDTIGSFQDKSCAIM